jgi:membrane fusion protein, multidrug efflux system
VDTNRSGTGPYRRRSILVATGFAIIAAGATAYWYWPRGLEPAPAARPAARAPVPVSVAVAARQNISVHLTGLGTVQASATVRVYSQVEGKLQEVLFTEGQHVKQGDVLAKIDPRLFQAAN